VSERRYMVVSEQIRGERRTYWICDRWEPRERKSWIEFIGSSQRAADKRCDELNGISDHGTDGLLRSEQERSR
jgi:hypothetical protein